MGEWKFEYLFMVPPYNQRMGKACAGEFLTDTTLLADDGIIIVEAIEGDRLCPYA